MDIPADVGQTVYVCVLKPAPLNQVIWCLGGERLLETSPQISLYFYEPGTYQLTALARQGDCWGQADVSLEVVAQTAIRLYDETGEEVDPEKPYPHTAMLFVQIENASDDPNPEVWIGKLGPDCKPTKLAVEELELGVYRGHFIPNGIGAQPGDVIWAFYRDPDSLEDFAWLTLPLR
jgi:hypothetical protein